MSRFSNLEFEGAEEFRESAGGPVKDEGHYLGLARGAFERAEFEVGLRHYARALEENPKCVEAWTGQVRMLIELGEYREAKAWADKALETFQQHAELLAAKAVALGRLGQWNDALAFSDAAFEERGGTPYVWLARADVLLARKESRADYCMDQALVLAAGDWLVAWLAARIRMHYQQMVQALKLLRRALEWDAGQPVVWCDLGRCEAATGQVALARTSFHRALELDGHCAAAQVGLNDLHRIGWWRRLWGSWRKGG